MTDNPTLTDRLPGDPSREEMIARILRVDQAGEYGAVRIYEGQLAVLVTFNRLLPERRVRPTALTPLWHVAGFALGAATALLGEKAAMACTVAVEEVIDEHYAAQSAQLGSEEPELKAVIDEFRQDELVHRDEGLAHGAEEAPGYELLRAAIKTGSRLAIWLSTRV
jgi:ubiquinone biosynthesis monooxygenase Coq7